MKKMMTLTMLVFAANVFASDMIIKTVETPLPASERMKGSDVAGAGGGGDIGGIALPPVTPNERIGQVVQTASSVVGLGEQVYTLLNKGKPNVTSDYAPVSIVPRDPISKEIVSPFDMEDCSMPVKKSFTTTMTTAGVEVVRFQYMLIYVYNCSYDGVGKYIQSAMIQPTTVRVGYGWDVDASMKLTGMMNHGKRADPIVGALLTVKYSMKSWRTALEKNETFHIIGNGVVKKY